MDELLDSFRIREDLRGYSFPQDRDARISDVALGLKFPSGPGYDVSRDPSAIEPVYPEKAIAAFLQFLMLQDTQYEVTASSGPATPRAREAVARVRRRGPHPDELLFGLRFCLGQDRSGPLQATEEV